MPTSRSNVVSSFTIIKGSLDRRDLRRVCRMGLLPDEAPEPPAPRAGQHDRRVEPELGARRSEGAEPPLRSRRARSAARRPRPGRLRPADLAAAAPVAHDARRVPRPRLPHHLALPAVRIRRVPPLRPRTWPPTSPRSPSKNGITWSGHWTRATTRPRRLGPASDRVRLRAPDRRRRTRSSPRTTFLTRASSTSFTR